MRKDLEAEALAPFVEMAEARGLEVFRGQGAHNRLFLGGNNYFQFGDLRVETAGASVVVETESGGGVTNLAKYWYWIQRNSPAKKLSLVHLFKQNSEHDYVAHLELWDFLAAEMRKDLAGKFSACRFCFMRVDDLGPALDEFARLLDSDGVTP